MPDDGRYCRHVDDEGKASLDVVGVTVSAAPPVGIQHVRLGRGLNAIYGKNGVGKTRLLTEIERTLSTGAYRLADGSLVLDGPPDRDPGLPPSAASALYQIGGVHLHRPTEASEHRSIRDVSHPLANVAVWLEDPWAPTHPRLGSVLADLKLTKEDLDALLLRGRWMLSATGDLYLCDDQPLNSPLTPHWLSEWDEWSRQFTNAASRQTRTTRRRIRWPDDDEMEWQLAQANGSDVPREWTFSGIMLRMPFAGRRDGRLLPPPPELLGLPPLPSWAGLPFVHVASEVWLHRPIISDGLLNGSIPRRVERWDEVTNLTVTKLRARSPEVLAEVSRFANELLADLFEAAPVLRLQALPASDWFNGQPPLRWEANMHPHGPWFPLADLGAAHQRFTTFAISRALDVAEANARAARMRQQPRRRPQVGLGTFVLIDEPERALHSSAERRLANALSQLGDRVLVSTHGTEILDIAASQGSITRLSWDDDGEMQALDARLPEGFDHAAAAEWGLTPSRLGSLSSAIVFVEGPHDQLVVDWMLHATGTKARWTTIPLGGTKELHTLASTGLVFAMSDAPIVVCTDNASTEALDRCRDELQRRRHDHQRFGYLADMRKDTLFRPQEMQQLLRLLEASVSHQRLDRVSLFGFSKRDIVEYLPMSLIDPRFQDWKQLGTAFLADAGRTSFAPGDGRVKKDWVNKHGGSYNVPGIKRALKHLEAHGPFTIHRDFRRLATRLEALTTAATPDPR